MAVLVQIPFKGSGECPKSREKTYAYLSDLEKAIQENFPGIESFKSSGKSTFLWVFKELSFQSLKLKLVFSTHLFLSPPDKIVVIPENNNSPNRLKAEWTLEEIGQKTRVTLDALIEAEAPIPSFLKGIFGPIADRELKKLLQRYLDNVAKTLST